MLPERFRFIQRGWFNCNTLLLLPESNASNHRPVVFDTGHFKFAQETVNLIQQAGAAPDQIGQIVITHGHCDHHGANHILKRLSGAEIIMGRLTADWFREKRIDQFWADHVTGTDELVLADRTVEAGDHIELSGLPFECIGLPGHAPDCIGYYQPDHKIMLCADALWETDFAVLHTLLHGEQVVEDAAASLDRLSQYDVNIAIPGHGNLIVDYQKSLDSARRRVARFMNEPRRISWHLTRRFLMYAILERQPISSADLEVVIGNQHWWHLYWPLCKDSHGRPPESATILYNEIISDFIQRKLVMESEIGLSTMLAL